MEKQSCVYIMTNRSNSVLYIGVTSNLARRIWEHKQHLVPGFTDKYNCTKLVYVDVTDNMTGAIEHEKKLKGWLRAKKEVLINSTNPDWHDLYDELLT